VSLQTLRREYASRALDEAGVSDDPIEQFRVWFDEACRAELVDVNAMTLATASADGEPSARTVLLKDVDARGFVFFTNYQSAKARDLDENPRASLLFFWVELERQVRVTGGVSKVAPDESAAYFQTRPPDSQLSAWASPQSAAVPDRAALELRVEAIRRKYEDRPIPLPPFWGGYRVAAERVEFWQGRPNRLHDRLLYTRRADGTWTRVRLAP
jgi:pyridoxamine 5'-phosphate oxidase